MESRRSRGLLLLLCAACAVLLLCAPALAYPAIDGETGTLTVTPNTVDGQTVDRLCFTLYKVADMSCAEGEDVVFDIQEPFQTYEESTALKTLELYGLDQTGWDSLARTLSSYVSLAEANGTNFDSVSAVTENGTGQVVFSGLKPAVYLLLSSYVGDADYDIETTPILITAPQLEGSSMQWQYSAGTDAKLGITKRPTTLTVRKVWRGDDTAELSKNRPEAITVSLLCIKGAGEEAKTEVYDSQNLNEENHWAYTWKNLPLEEDGQRTSWKVVEAEVPSGYHAYIEGMSDVDSVDLSTSRTITLVNTTAGVYGEYREGGSKKPSSPGGVKGSARSGDTASEQSAEKLPQTGQLWWPVWILTAAGALLVVIGLLVRRSGKHDSLESGH